MWPGPSGRGSVTALRTKTNHSTTSDPPTHTIDRVWTKGARKMAWLQYSIEHMVVRRRKKEKKNWTDFLISFVHRAWNVKDVDVNSNGAAANIFFVSSKSYTEHRSSRMVFGSSIFIFSGPDLSHTNTPCSIWCCSFCVSIVGVCEGECVSLNGAWYCTQ